MRRIFTSVRLRCTNYQCSLHTHHPAEKQEPAFLRKLRGEHGGNNSHVPIARPRKAKNDEDDDAPTYVDEESNEVLSKEEYEALVNDDTSGKEAPAEGDKQPKGTDGQLAGDGEMPGRESEREKQNVAEVGGPKKRKQVKVVGDDDVDETDKKTGNKEDSGTTSRPKGKKMKIKLSFDEPVDG